MVYKLSGKWEMIWKNPDCLSGFLVIRSKIFGRTKISTQVLHLKSGVSFISLPWRYNHLHSGIMLEKKGVRLLLDEFHVSPTFPSASASVTRKKLARLLVGSVLQLEKINEKRWRQELHEDVNNGPR